MLSVLGLLALQCWPTNWLAADYCKLTPVAAAWQGWFAIEERRVGAKFCFVLINLFINLNLKNQFILQFASGVLFQSSNA